MIHAKDTALRVLLQWSQTQMQTVGRLAMHGHKIFFEFHPDFIASGLQLSPGKMQVRPEQARDRRSPPSGWYRVGRAMCRLGETFEPGQDQARYDQLYSRVYRGLYPALRESVTFETPN